VHQNFLVEYISPYNPIFQQYYDQLRQWLQAHQPQLATPSATLAEIYQLLLRQAKMMAFNDAFWVLAIATAILVPLTIFFRQKSAGAPTAGAPL
jgi:hypothetical protein